MATSRVVDNEVIWLVPGQQGQPVLLTDSTKISVSFASDFLQHRNELLIAPMQWQIPAPDLFGPQIVHSRDEDLRVITGFRPILIPHAQVIVANVFSGRTQSRPLAFSPEQLEF